MAPIVRLRRAGYNTTTLPDALWFVYMIYLKGYGKDFQEALRLYRRDMVDPNKLPLITIEETQGMNFIKAFLIQ